MTAILAKLGLQLAQGAGTGRLIVALALLAAIAIAGGWSIWYVADLGRQAALAECAAGEARERGLRREAEKQRDEANREVIIRHIAEAARLPAAAEEDRKGVRDEVDANPAVVLCGLSARGLQWWNADPFELRLPNRPGSPGAAPREPPAGRGGNTSGPHEQPHGLEARLPDALAQAPGPRRGSPQLPLDGGRR